MYRYSLIIFSVLAILFSGCSPKKPTPRRTIIKPYKDENKYLLYAFMLSQNGDFEGADKYFVKLYNHTKNIAYLKYAISLSAKLKKYDEFYKLVKEGLKDYPDNDTLKRELIRYYLYKKDYQKATSLTLELIKKSKTEENYKFAGSVFLNLKNYELSFKAFEKAYSFHYNEDILNNLADILYLFLNKKDDAIAYLETHTRLRGCSKKICFKLIDIYAREKDINGLISTYKRLYNKFKEDRYAKKAAELMLYQGEKEKAIQFLKTNGVDKQLLADLYVSMKDFKDAYKITKELYKKTKDLKYLGRMAIYEYEGSTKKDKKLLNSVAEKFAKVVKTLNDPLYLNYYGYLLIDHDMDVKKGIELVKKALKQDPNSPYYLDSLAWGYYKLGLCKKAKKIMAKVAKMSKDKEVQKHIKAIDECLKEKSK